MCRKIPLCDFVVVFARRDCYDISMLAHVCTVMWPGCGPGVDGGGGWGLRLSPSACACTQLVGTCVWCHPSPLHALLQALFTPEGAYFSPPLCAAIDYTVRSGPQLSDREPCQHKQKARLSGWGFLFFFFLPRILLKYAACKNWKCVV